MAAIQLLTPNNYAKACALLAKAEPQFAVVAAKYGFPPFWQRDPGFGTLVQIILEQQVSLASGKAHYEKLYAYTNGLQLENLGRMRDEEYRSCHISRQKMSYIRSLTELVQAGNLQLETMADLPDDAVAKALVAVKGIGPWTASIYLMFCLRRPDHFPPGDIAAINAAKDLFPEMAGYSHAGIHEAAARWAPYRTVATYFLWWWYLRLRNREATV